MKWDNWIGSTNIDTGQERYPRTWNLSEIRGPAGNTVTYEYANSEYQVSSYSLYYTRQSHLTKITDTYGRTVSFSYANKSPNEYQDNHTESSEPDTYQEFFENKYLTEMVVRAADLTEIFTIDFNYELVSIDGTGPKTKRYLTSIVQQSPDGRSLPGYVFSYRRSNPHYGAIATAKHPLGMTAVYTYGSQYPSKSSRNKTITRPSSSYGSPRFWISENYIVVTWYDGAADKIKLYVYTWNGWWDGNYLGEISGIDIQENEQNFEVFVERDHFALITHFYDHHYLKNVYLYHKHQSYNTSGAGNWKGGYQADFNPSDSKIGVATGNDFIAMVSLEYGHRRHFRWDGDSWVSNLYGAQSNDNQWDFHVTGKNNWYLVHNSEDDNVNIYYLDETKEWNTLAIPGSLVPTSTDFGNWYAGDFFAVAFLEGGPEYIYRWNENFSSVYRDVVIGSLPDDSRVFIHGPTFFISGDDAKGFRWNGNDWKELYLTEDSYTAGTLTDDTVIRVRRVSSGWIKRYVYNPVTATWSLDDDISAYTANTESGSPVSYGWAPQYGTPGLYSRETGGWGSKYSVSNWDDYDKRFSVGQTFYTFENWIGYNAADHRETRIGLIKNGEWQTNYYLDSNYLRKHSARFQSLVTMNNSDDDLTTSLNIYRIAAEGWTSSIPDYPVTQILLDDQVNHTLKTKYEYPGAGCFDPTGSIAQYNKVKTSTPIDGSYGSTIHYFFNGLPRAQLPTVDRFPANGTYTNAENYFGLLTGSKYRTELLNNSSTLVASSSTDYKATNVTLGSQDQAAYARPMRQMTMADGITTATTMSYNLSNGLVTTQSTANSDGVSRVTKTEYAYSKYSGMENAHMLSQVAQKTTYRGSVSSSNARASAVTTYKDWGSGNWAPERNYSWAEIRDNCLAGTYSLPTFDAWMSGESPTSGEWIRNRTILERDSRGQVIVSADAQGVQSSIDYRYNDLLPLGTAENASKSEWAVETYESEITGWHPHSSSTHQYLTADTAFTGRLACAVKSGTAYSDYGIAKGFNSASLDLSKTYTFTAWVRAPYPNDGNIHLQLKYQDGSGWHYPTPAYYTKTDGSWQLLEVSLNLAQIPGLLSISAVARNTGSNAIPCYWDDFRFHPKDAMVTHATFDKVNFQTLSTSDATNHAIRYRYDDFHRLIYSTNDVGNLLTISNTYYSRTGATDDLYHQSDPNYTQTAAYSQGPSERSLVGFWPLDYSPDDRSRYQNIGTIHGVEYTRGYLGQGALFGGTDYIQVTDAGASSLDVDSGALTLSAWVYPTADNSNMMILNKESCYEIQLKYNATYDSLDFQVAIATDQQTWLWQTLGRVKKGRWTHVAATYDGQYIRGYIDGEFSKSYTRTGNVLQNNHDLRIGARGGDGTPTSYFTGRIDEVQVFHSTLTGTEILALATPSVTTKYSDALGRPLITQHRRGNGVSDFTNIWYDAATGKVYRSFYPKFYTSATYAPQTAYWGNRTYYDYETDPRMRPKRTAEADQQWINFAYEHVGNQYHITTVTDQNGIQSRTRKDKFGNTLKSVRAFGLSDSSVTITRYDIAGNIVDIEDPRGLHSSRVYDTRGLLLEESTPDAGTVKSIYDKNGRLIYSQDANQATQADFLVYKYDALGRLDTLAVERDQLFTWTSGSYPVIDDAHLYGLEGNEIKILKYYDTDYTGEANVVQGRLTKIINVETNTTTLYAYDADGNITLKETQIPGLPAKRIYHHYDALGRDILTEYPSGRTVARTFNARGHLINVDTAQ